MSQFYADNFVQIDYDIFDFAWNITHFSMTLYKK